MPNQVKDVDREDLLRVGAIVYQCTQLCKQWNDSAYSRHYRTRRRTARAFWRLGAGSAAATALANRKASINWRFRTAGSFSAQSFRASMRRNAISRTRWSSNFGKARSLRLTRFTAAVGGVIRPDVSA